MKTQGWGVGTIAGFGILAVSFAACAGKDVPLVDDDLRTGLEDRFGGGAGGQTGSAAGRGGQPSGGSGNATPGAGGSAVAEAGASGAGGGEPIGGGNSGSSGASAGGGTLCDAYTTILVPSCGLAGCHLSPSSQGAFVNGQAALADFVDRPSTFDTCDGLYIDSSDTSKSLILTKTSQDFPQGCGNLQMPLTGDLLTPAQVDCLQEWLTQFAQ